MKGIAVSKFNTGTARPMVAGPIRTEHVPSGHTREGGSGYARDTKSQLFLLAVSNMVGEDTFYEAAGERDGRFVDLVRQVAAADFDWLLRFARWLRTEANMRSASLVLAAEAAKARLDAEIDGSRPIVDAVLQRADEPGEMISYWISHYGKRIPKPVKRGVSDACGRLYNERSYLKWDSDSHGIRFADVIQLAHADPCGEWQSDLFKYAIERRLGINAPIPDRLGMLKANADLRRLSVDGIQEMAADGHLAAALAESGVTWQAVPSLINGPWTRQLWEAVVPSMGYMATLRNLRNFDQAEVSDKVAAEVAARLADPEQVARSRQFPFRFFAAHKNTGSLRWGHALETALRHSLSNLPTLTGRTLILVDQSPSMFPGPQYSGSASQSDIVSAERAALFGTALALRVEDAELFGYGFGSYPVKFGKGDAVLKTMQKFHVDSGTDTFGALQRHYANHDRVLIVTDEQTAVNRQMADPYVRRQYGLDVLRPINSIVPVHVPVYTWNLCGYEYGHATGQNWHTFGGLTDQAFGMIPLLERGRGADWPF